MGKILSTAARSTKLGTRRKGEPVVVVTQDHCFSARKADELQGLVFL